MKYTFDSMDEVILAADRHLKKEYWQMIQGFARITPPMPTGDEQLFLEVMYAVISECPFVKEPVYWSSVLRYTKNPNAWFETGRPFRLQDWQVTAATCAIFADILDTVARQADSV